MIVGFTGSRDGMTQKQVTALNGWWEDMDVTEFHHGACVGSDETAVSCCENFTRARIVAHPCTLKGLVSQKSLDASVETREARPPLERNQCIVDAADVLVATPKGEEEFRGGTWHTIRLARKAKKPIVILWPNGSVRYENR